MRVVIVTWHDAFVVEDNHVDVYDQELTAPYIRKTVGWLARHTDKEVAVAQTKDKHGVGHVAVIPTEAVRYVEVIDDGD